jgi:hypothetical protein
MNKFIITEEEKNRILGMHQDHGYNSLNEQTTADNKKKGYTPQFGTDAKKNVDILKAQAAPQKSDIKTTKFPCFTSTSVPYDYNPKRGDTVGNYAPANMDFLRMFQDNAIIVAWQNNTIKQYVRNGNAAGAETKKGTWKCKANNLGVDVVMTDSVAKKQPPKPALKAAGQSTPNTTGSSIGVIYQYEYPNDNKYRYGVKDGKWFGKNLANGKEFDLSTIKTTVANLNNKFPNALTQEETLVEPEVIKTTAVSADALAGSTPPAAPATGQS